MAPRKKINTNGDIEDKKGANLSPEQRKYLINFIYANQLIIHGKLTNATTRLYYSSMWADLTSKLNAIPGAKKTWKQWRKCWQDIRSAVKGKNAEIRRYQRGTGGGPPPPPKDDLKDWELKVLEIIGPTAAEGIDITESGADFEFEDGSQIQNNNTVEDDDKLESEEEERNENNPLTVCSPLQSSRHNMNVASNLYETAAKLCPHIPLTLLTPEKERAASSIMQLTTTDNLFSLSDTPSSQTDPSPTISKKSENIRSTISQKGSAPVSSKNCKGKKPKKNVKRTSAQHRLAMTAIATEKLAALTETKLKSKEQYFQRKLQLLERQVVAQEVIAASLQILAANAPFSFDVTEDNNKFDT